MKHAFWALTLIAGITACSNNSDSDGNSGGDTSSPALLNADQHIDPIFPPQGQVHTHASNLALCGDHVMAVWFSGDGERTGNEVRIKGSTARIPQTGALTWQPAFDVGYNGTGTPDTNPALITEPAQGGAVCASVEAIWETINFKDWAGAELRYRDATVSTDSNGNPSFDWEQGLAGERFTLNLADGFKDTLADQLGNSWPLKNNRFDPVGFASFAVGIVTPEALYEAIMSLLKGRMSAMSDLEFAAMADRLSDVNDTEGSALNQLIESTQGPGQLLTSIDTLRSAGSKIEGLLTFVFRLYDQYVIARLETRTLDSDSRYYQLGWETRENPQIIKRGDQERWLLPLYSDDLGISVVAYSDDDGDSWTATTIATRQGIQPSVVETTNTCEDNSQQLMAIMRNNGGVLNLNRALVSYSCNSATAWKPAQPLLAIKNESSSLTAKRITWAGDDRISIVYNPDSKRESLNLALGSTAGADFNVQTLLDVDASKKDLGISYQYPALVQLPGGDLVISFSWHTGNTPSCTRVAKDCQTIGVVRMNPDTISRP